MEHRRLPETQRLPEVRSRFLLPWTLSRNTRTFTLRFLRLSQQLIFANGSLTPPNIGSLLQHFTETVVGRVFHPSELNQENFLAYQPLSQLEKEILGDVGPDESERLLAFIR